MNSTEKRRKKKQRDSQIVMEALVMVFQFGVNMIVPILMCTFLGVWIGNKTGASWVTVPLFFVGAIAGGQNIYRMAKKLIRSGPDKTKKQDKT